MKNNIIIVLAIICSPTFSWSQIKKPTIKQPDLPIKTSTINSEKPMESPASTYIDGAKNNITALENLLADPKWNRGGFDGSFDSNLESLEKKIVSIQQKDKTYNTAEFETKLTYFKAEREKGIAAAKEGQKAYEQELMDKETARKKEAYDKERQKRPDNGIISPIHQKHIGEIVFSKSKIDPSTNSEANFVNEFTILETIHFCAFFEESVFNNLIVNDPSPSTLDARAGFYCKIYIDQKLVLDKQFSTKLKGIERFSDEDRVKATTLSGAFDLKLNELGSDDFFLSLLETEATLTPGKHTYKVELYGKRQMSDEPIAKSPMATGEFTLTITPNFINPKDYVTCMPSSKKTDAGLEKKFLEQAKKDWSGKYGMAGDLNNIVLRSSDWVIVKNEYTGKIIKRVFKAAFAVTNEGKCKYIVFSFVQDYNGSGYNSETYTDLEIEEGPIFCGCIN